MQELMHCHSKQRQERRGRPVFVLPPEAVDEYERRGGMPLRELAERFHVHIATVANAIRRQLGKVIKQPVHRSKVIPGTPRYEELAAFARGEKRFVELNLGISKQRVFQLCHSLGLSLEGDRHHRIVLSEENVQRLLNYDVTPKKLAAELGVSGQVILKALRRQGRKIPHDHSPGTTTQKIVLSQKDLEAYSAKKMTHRQLAEKYGCCSATIFTALERQGVATVCKPRKDRFVLSDSDIARLMAGETIEATTNRLRTTWSTIMRAIMRQKIELPWRKQKT